MLEYIQNENPALTAVAVDVSSEEYDLAAIGECNGRIKTLLHLKLDCHDDVEDVDSLKAFCKGFVQNRSMKSLSIKGNPATDSLAEVSGYLLPFFANNANFECISLHHRSDLAQNAHVENVVANCQALKSITIEDCRDRESINIIGALGRQDRLEHFCINDCHLSETSSSLLKTRLEGWLHLKSVTFSFVTVNKPRDAIDISRALAANKGIRSLDIESGRFATSFFSSISSNELVSLENLLIFKGGLHLDSAIRQMVSLKNHSPFLGTRLGCLGKVLQCALRSSSTLHELQIRYPGGNQEAVIQHLASHLPFSTSLKRFLFSFSAEYVVPSTACDSFFRSIKTMTHLEEIELSRLIRLDSALSDCLVSLPGLKVCGFLSIMLLKQANGIYFQQP